MTIRAHELTFRYFIEYRAAIAEGGNTNPQSAHRLRFKSRYHSLNS
jgi:hypothetical protein